MLNKKIILVLVTIVGFLEIGFAQNIIGRWSYVESVFDKKITIAGMTYEAVGEKCNVCPDIQFRKDSTGVVSYANKCDECFLWKYKNDSTIQVSVQSYFWGFTEPLEYRMSFFRGNKNLTKLKLINNEGNTLILIREEKYTTN